MADLHLSCYASMVNLATFKGHIEGVLAVYDLQLLTAEAAMERIRELLDERGKDYVDPREQAVSR